jgi:cyclopropane-fatty-acyl-phospholipid synthase
VDLDVIDRRSARPHDPTVDRARAVIEQLFGPVIERHFAVRFWDGTVDAPPCVGAVPFTIVLRTPGALRRMFLPPSELRLGEAFVRGEFDVEGDLEGATALADGVRRRLSRSGALIRLALRLLAIQADPPPTRTERRPLGLARVAPVHSLRRDAAAIRSHYDVGNDFYALWLDQRMVYSCAYFETGHENLDTAQTAKLEHLCRKLRLRPGERLLDIGCGWGGLVRYAVERYGVHALGVTLSPAQASLANERLFDAGLATRCGVEVIDYRDLDEDQSFDKIVSVGMFEHVGRAQLPTYFGKVFRLLKPGGLFLNHGIIRSPGPTSRGLAGFVQRAAWRQGAFIDRYVFPDGELVTLEDVVGRAEDVGFEARDVESLREHYALTLRRWVRRLEAAEAQATRLVGPQTYRVWRLYMAASAHAFASHRIGIAQTLFAKPDSYGQVMIPLTRRDLYRADAGTVVRALQ